MANTAASGSTEVKRVGKFGLVGILNTLIDYIIFISLTKILSIPLERVWIAKFISGAIAMANSFYLNRRWVFSSHAPDLRAQALRFLLVTLVGVFGIQTGLVQIFSNNFPYFGELAYQIADAISLTKLLPALLTKEFIIKTVAFGLATIASMTWNFILYKKVVFKR